MKEVLKVATIALFSLISSPVFPKGEMPQEYSQEQLQNESYEGFLARDAWQKSLRVAYGWEAVCKEVRTRPSITDEDRKVISDFQNQYMIHIVEFFNRYKNGKDVVLALARATGKDHEELVAFLEKVRRVSREADRLRAIFPDLICDLWVGKSRQNIRR